MALQTQDGAQWHVAVVYKHDNQSLYIFHLAFHYLFRNEQVTGANQDYFVAPIGESEAANLEVMCAAFSNLEWPDAPYGLDSAGCIIDEHHELVSAPIGKGFTCATAIIAIFRSLGFDLIDESKWPNRPEDSVWQSSIINAVEVFGQRHSIPDIQDHIESMKSDIGAIRVRPTEVAAAGVRFDLPTEFTDCQSLAASIESDVNAQLGY